MQTQLNLAKSFLERIGANFEEGQLAKYVERNINAKSNLNQLLGLTAENNYTVTLPVTLDNSTIIMQYTFLNNVLTSILHDSDYKDIDYVKGTVVNPKGQTIKITRVLPKFQEQIIKHPNYDRACRELGISDSSFASIGPRIGELANSSNQELFITSSIAEFMMVNDHSSYTSCYRHSVFTDTSYWTGTLSYGIDTFTLLVGIRNKSTKYKTGRSWLWLFSDGIDSEGVDMESPFMVQPKSYGEFTSLHRKAVRMFIQNKIANDVTWKKGVLGGGIKYNSNYGYIDNYDLTISWIKGEEKPKPFINFASDLWCLNCGDDMLGSGDGLCYSCTDDSDYRECENCGERVHEDDCYYGRDDNCYCQSCYNELFFYCEVCCEDEWLEDSRGVRGCKNGREYTELVCSHCAGNVNTISYCEGCDTYYFNNEIREIETVEGDCVCEKCVKLYCADCGNAITEQDETFEVGVNTYCRHCIENNVAEEDEDCEADAA